MSDTISGCIQHKDTRYIQVRCDYMGLYQGNEHKAKIIRILETWTDFKRTEWYKDNLDRIEQGQEVSEPDFWITMSHKQFRQFMFGTSSIDTIKSCLDELVKAKHIERRISPDNPYGAPQYLLNYRAIQKGLNKLGAPSFVPELPPQEEVTPPGKPTPPTGVQNTPTLGGELPLPQGGKSATSYNSTKNLTENKEECVCSEPPTESSPPREDTHTSLSNSSSSSREQVAETATTTPQAHSSAETAMSASAPRTPDSSPPVSPQGVRGVFPPDDNVVGVPPADNKAQVNPSKKPGWKALLDYWDSKYGPSPRPKWVEDEAKDMIERMKPTPEQVDKVCAELKALKKPVTFETMYNNWHLLKEVEEREQAKTHPVPKSVSGRRRVEDDPAYAEYLSMMKGGGK